MQKEILEFDSGWLFSKLPAETGADKLPVWERDFDDKSWETVSLPHTYNNEDGVQGKVWSHAGNEVYYRGLVCYRKRFDGAFAGKRVFVEFGAANTVAQVYVNGNFVGRHEGGYAAFRFDITDYLRPADNVIAVTVDNGQTDYIAPIIHMGDFTKMGGLYRKAKLIVTEPVHIDLMDYAAPGVYITPKNITEEAADVDICVKLANDSPEDADLTVMATLFDMQGKAVACAEQMLMLSAGQKGQAQLCTAVLSPTFWQGRENPYLYIAQIFLFRGKTMVDQTEESFGIRTFYADKDNGFFLNGKYLELKGAGYHQDSETGWAMTERQWDRDYQLMLDMGNTAVRLAHYQHAPYEYALCDRAGLAVWAEIGIINQMAANRKTMEVSPKFEANASQQLIELIRQNYNHPSIFFWGISNELHQDSDEILGIFRRLSELAAQEDPTRLRTFADNIFRGPFLDMPVDVMGCNRYFGWYEEGPVENFGPWFDLHKTQTKMPVCVSEYGGGGALSQHKDQPVWEEDIDIYGRRHYEEYQTDLHEKTWEQLSQRPYLWGKFIWIMFDFACANREEGDLTGQNDKGMATRQRQPKDVYYFYKSAWNPAPMVYLPQKRFAVRPAPIPEVKVYANAQRVELLVNGQSVGFGVHTDTLTNVFRWQNVALKKGDNQILAKAYFPDGKVLEDSTIWTAAE